MLRPLLDEEDAVEAGTGLVPVVPAALFVLVVVTLILLLLLLVVELLLLLVLVLTILLCALAAASSTLGAGATHVSSVGLLQSVPKS